MSAPDSPPLRGPMLRVAALSGLGGLLFGYDTGVINGAIGPLKTHFQLDEFWAGWATGCALLGCALGAAAALVWYLAGAEDSDNTAVE